LFGSGSEVLGYDTERSTDPEVSALPRNIGAVDQWVDSTDVLSWPPRTRQAATWYARPGPTTP